MTKRQLTEEEKKLLKAAMKDVVPLGRKAIAEKPVIAAPIKKIKKAVALPPATAPAPAPSQGGVDKETIRKVKRGEYAIDARLDLHGLTLSQAHARLVAFVESQHQRHSRCLLVITGKGGRGGEKGPLQKEVPRWLSLSDIAGKILVVSSAQAKHGGQGALYVLLRRKRT